MNFCQLLLENFIHFAFFEMFCDELSNVFYYTVDFPVEEMSLKSQTTTLF